MNTLVEPHAGFEAWRQSRLDEYEAHLDTHGLEDWKRAQPLEAQAKLDKEMENRKQVRMKERKVTLKAEWLILVSKLSNIPESPCRDTFGGSTTKLCSQPDCNATGYWPRACQRQ
jgi:hypothetical protein